ncbi:MAG: hypothetical protein KDK70_25365 [Myxococcales bacterium]|nr:hypothetical protein [Myxococcales bacterium]
MRSAARALVACTLLAIGCAVPNRPPPCTPGPIPPIGTHHLTLTAPGDSSGPSTPTTTASATSPAPAAPKDPKPSDAAADGAAEADDTADTPTDEAPEATDATDTEADSPDEPGPDSPDEPAPDADSSEPSEASTSSEPLDPAEATPDDDSAPAPAPASTDPLAAFEAARDDMERSADWLLCVVPYQLPDEDLDAWVERRNLVMDWIENHPTLGYTFSASIMAPIHKDRKFSASMYMNLAYAIGKARYLLSATPPDPVEAEIAALDAVVQYYVTFETAEPKLRARKLARLMRKKKKGKLRPWIAKKLAGG